MIVIGLTGNVGTGKTSVSQMFASLGAKVIPVDQVAHQLLWPTGACFNKVVRVFGKQIMRQGRIDRKILGEMVFSKKSRLRELERIVHPGLIKEVRRRLSHYARQKRFRVVVIDAALLFKLGLHKNSDVLICVTANKKDQIKRAAKQLSVSETDVKKRFAFQMPIKQKALLSDIVIDNSRSFKKTRSQVKKIWKEIKQ